MKYDFTDKEFEEAKQAIFEEAMSAGTLGDYDVDTNTLTYSLIPYIVWREISLGASRVSKLAKAVFEVDISGESGNQIHIATLSRDEFTAQSISEETLDNDGLTKTKMSPSSVRLEIGDVIYNATRISDILSEDSHLPWARAALQKMGQSIAYKIEQDIETELYTSGGSVVGCAGTLTYERVMAAKQTLKDLSWFDTEEPFLLFVNPSDEKDLLTENVTTNVFLDERYKEGSLEDFYGSPIYAGCIATVSEVVRSKFAYLIVAPVDFAHASTIFAWKRKPKQESWRDEQKQRDVFSLSTRYGLQTAQPTGITILSNC